MWHSWQSFLQGPTIIFDEGIANDMLFEPYSYMTLFELLSNYSTLLTPQISMQL